MSLMWLYVALGGFTGAISRYATIQYVNARFSTAFPYGTLAVNVIGSFALGVVLGTDMRQENKYAYAALGVGFLGSFTTFSTYAVESLLMSQKKHWRALILYQLFSYGLSIGAAAIGYVCSRSLT